MQDPQDPQEMKDLRELAPYLEVLKRLQGLDFAASLPLEGWKELARTLREATGGDREHAARIVDQFLRAERFDDRGNLETKIPAPIELRMFAREVPKRAMPDGELPHECPLCAPYGGLWRLVERGGVEATDRCLCSRGEALRARDAARGATKPVQRAKRSELSSAEDWAKRAAGDIE